MSRYKFDKENHLHTLYGKALTGTSSVVGVLAKPFTWWASGLAVSELGWIKKLDIRKKSSQEEIEKNEKERIASATDMLKKFKQMSPSDYVALLDKAYKAHATSLNKSAKKGTDLHAELEAFVKGRMGKVEIRKYDEKINPFIEWTDKNIKRFIASEAHTYSENLFVGGITDCIAELNDGTYAIIDFKSSKEAYRSQFIQCGGYAIQIEESGIVSSDGVHEMKLDKPISQLIVVPFGSPRPAPVIMRGVDTFKNAFKCAVALYRLLENYEE